MPATASVLQRARAALAQLRNMTEEERRRLAADGVTEESLVALVRQFEFIAKAEPSAES